MPIENLYPGDTIMYRSRMFVFGDPRGEREGVVTDFNTNINNEYPMSTTTGEM